MSCDCQTPDGERTWVSSDGTHIDLRGATASVLRDELLGLIDAGGAGPVVIAHLDEEPLLLYPDLDDRGWAHEVVGSDCGDDACASDVRLKLVSLCA